MRARRSSQETHGGPAAATMKPMKMSGMTTLIFQSASAATTTLRATSVATAARRAVVPIARVCCPSVERSNPMDEQVFVDQRRHGIVLVRPFARALLLAGCGVVGLVLGWPGSLAGGILVVVAAAYALAAVLRWDRTHVVLTQEKLFVVHGILRRRAAAV